MTDVLGKRRKVYFFAMVLCRSRYKFVEYSDKHYTTQKTILAMRQHSSFSEGTPRKSCMIRIN
jgi:transposase